MRVVIFANGLMDDSAADVRAWTRPDDHFVAADGGARHAMAAGIRLHHVIGDMDSLDQGLRRRLEEMGAEFHIAPVAKDETDLELALLWAAARPHVHEIVVLGAFGGRPDQALANLLLLALPELASHRVLMIDGRWSVRVIRGGERVTFRGAPGDCLSLIPLGGPARGVTTERLAFPLAAETLALGPARGVSNRFEAESATVTVQEGLLWCFQEQSSARGGL
ncbi:MAG: thiamine diphosphokinase [Chloroflexota bacterium]|nr:thiamine diphosphokinase [Chloroflexota bacterium]